METELTEIRKAIKIYKNTRTIQEFNAAESYLIKIHNKYGTIDTHIIENLIK